MPFPNEHACRLKDPGLYSRFARIKKDHKGKQYSIIVGVKKSDGKSEAQSHRYPKDTWSASEARAHCAGKGGSFEAASGGDDRKACPCGGAAKNAGCQYKERNGRLMEMKSFPFELEKINDAGEFNGFLSTHGNIDEGMDRFNFGTWKRTLTIQKGKRFPWLHVHKMEHQTGSFAAEETKEGLYINGKLNLTVFDLGRGNSAIAVPKALEQYALMKSGDVKTMSVGYRVTNKGYKYTTENGMTIRDIFEAELVEGSLTPIPMNKMAVIGEVKDFSNFSPEAIIDYLMKHRNNAELWEQIFQIKSNEPEIEILDPFIDADPGYINSTLPAMRKQVDDSTHGMLEQMIMQKYRRLVCLE